MDKAEIQAALSRAGRYESSRRHFSRWEAVISSFSGFTGDAENNFVSYDAGSGERLRSYQTGSGIRGAPIAFQLDGKEYVAIAAGMSGSVGGYTGAGAPWMRNYRSEEPYSFLPCTA